MRHQLHGNVIQSTSRVLKEEVAFDSTAVASREWGAYPILTFPEVPAIEVVMMQRQDQPPLGAGESASVPSAAAIANAIFDATGVRFREVPFTPERIRAGLGGTAPARRSGVGVAYGGLARGLRPARPAGGAAAAVAAGHRADPAPGPGGVFRRHDRTRRLLAAHGRLRRLPHAARRRGFAGGLALDTPFGRIWSTNITPDAATGIGGWSYPAFERAMRQGIQPRRATCYPGHPYTVVHQGERCGPAGALRLPDGAAGGAPTAHPRPSCASRSTCARCWPAGTRCSCAPASTRPTPPGRQPGTAAPTWWRGSAIAAPATRGRNALGAERTGAAHLAGGFADGWEAPALTALSHAPIPWTEAALFDYLRTGASPFHGPAAGPMAAVVASLSALPDSDIRAMAGYLASFAPPGPPADEAALAARAEARAGSLAETGAGARIYAGACASCHEGEPRLPSLALNSNLHSPTPNNLIRSVLGGVQAVSRPELGNMPGFADTLSDSQVESLARYLRARFAPDAPEWTDFDTPLQAARDALSAHAAP